MPSALFRNYGIMWRLAAAIVATGAAAAIVRATAAAAALLAADPDQDDHDDDPPPVVFTKERVGRAHKEFPPIKDFTSYYGDCREVGPMCSNLFCQYAVLI